MFYSFREYLWQKQGKYYRQLLWTQLKQYPAAPQSSPLVAFAARPFDVEKISLVRINLYRKSMFEVWADILLDAALVYTFTDGNHTRVANELRLFYIRTHINLTRCDCIEQEIDEIGLWNHSVSVPGRSLDEYLVPHTCKNSFDEIAQEILSVYCPEALTSPVYDSGRLLATRMGLRTRQYQLSEDHSIRGKFYFGGGTEYREDPDGVLNSCYFPGKTIVVDPLACGSKNNAARHNLINDTIIHECVHAYEHYLFYLGQCHCQRNFSSIACSVPGYKTSNSIETGLAMRESNRLDLILSGEQKLSARTPVDWIEWQACKTTPRVSMPEAAFRAALNAFLTNLSCTQPLLSEETRMERVSKYAAKAFGTSIQSARQRMIEIGFDQARGVMNYADRKYVRSFRFTPGFLEDNQTFTISFKDALDVYRKDGEFRQFINSGHYIFIAL